MASDGFYRRVVIEYGLQYVYLYVSDQNGKVLADEFFKQPYRMERSEVAEEARDCFDVAYDALNETINFPGTAGD